METSKLFPSRLVVTDGINSIPVTTVQGRDHGPNRVCQTGSSIQGDECVLQGSVNASAVRVAGNVVVNGKVRNCLGSLFACISRYYILYFMITGMWMETC